ncbi:hypothetical protein GBF38_021282, partial [Nibea albiflora]
EADQHRCYMTIRNLENTHLISRDNNNNQNQNPETDPNQDQTQNLNT